MQITRDRSALLVVDIQSKLAPHIADHETLIRRTDALLAAAALFGVPKLATEHCPNQIGPVIEPLRAQFAADEIFMKTSFGATGHPDFIARVQRTGRRTIVMTGMEAHVCVLQTALGLRAIGLDVCIVTDAVGSRGARRDDREFALRRLERAGCLLAGTETVLYEWTGDATDARFREVLKLVKAL
jgi:nicotinamidase-related amidase